MRFEWDGEKNRRNLAKHKISFETVRLVFDGPGALSVQDRVVNGEERWQSMGIVSGVWWSWPIPGETKVAMK